MKVIGLEWIVARSEWRRVEWPDRSEGEWNGVELKELEWRVARSEWRRVG